MREKRSVPLIVIGASIPFMWLLVWVLSRVGFFGFITSLELSEFMETLIIVLIANIPVLVFIGYGIYNAVTAPATIPKVKERMPWERGTAADIDAEWKEKVKERDEGSN